MKTHIVSLWLVNGASVVNWYTNLGLKSENDGTMKVLIVDGAYVCN